jgi:hypothetical protein
LGAQTLTDQFQHFDLETASLFGWIRQMPCKNNQLQWGKGRLKEVSWFGWSLEKYCSS